MADPRFYKRAGPFSLAQLAEWSGARLAAGADSSALIEDVAPLSQALPSMLSFLDNIKYAGEFSQSQAGACLVREKYTPKAPAGMALLISDDPYRAYALLAACFYPPLHEGRISSRAFISDSARIGSGCTIEAGAFIGDGVEIGDDCRIGANVTISHSIIGKRVIIHAGAHIGQDGFGFAMSAKGHLKVPQLGRVLIGDDAEIGAGTCIDRGAGPDTVIGEGCKIDNLVQIGHNARIGKHVVIVAQVGISGSSVIGDYAVLGGQSGVAGHLEVGAGAQIAAQSGVAQNLEGGKIYGGTPAVPIRDWHRQTATLHRLIKGQPLKMES